MVILDSDMIVLKNIDELFCLPEGSFTTGMATPYNAALSVVTPGKVRYAKMKQLVRQWSNVKTARKKLQLKGEADEVCSCSFNQMIVQVVGSSHDGSS